MWFSLSTLVSPTNKTDHNHFTEILLKVVITFILIIQLLVWAIPMYMLHFHICYRLFL